jgi:hypothetical protein
MALRFGLVHVAPTRGSFSTFWVVLGLKMTKVGIFFSHHHYHHHLLLVGLNDEEPMIFLPFFSFLAGRRRSRGFCSFFYFFYLN